MYIRLMCLDAEAEPSEEYKDRVAAKYYYAGGSARYMFRMKTADVINFVERGLNEITDKTQYLTSMIGDRTTETRNRILGSFLNNKGERYSFLLSEYAAVLVGISAGPPGVRAIHLAIKAYANRAIEGWLFEMLFFANLSSGNLHLRSNVGAASSIATAQAIIHLKESPEADVFERGDVWIKPLLYNQAGFDCVHVDADRKLIEFYQITIAATHSFKIAAFANFLKNMVDKKAYTLSVSFIVPQQNLDSFSLGTITGLGRLSEFVGWSRGTEGNNVQFLSMNGFDK